MGLFDFIYSFFGKELTPEQIKQKRLREIKNELSKTSKLFNSSKIQAQPNMAKLLYHLYKMFVSFKLFAQRYKSSDEVLHFVVEKYLNDAQKKSLEFVYSFSAKDAVSLGPDVPKNLNTNLSYLFKSLSQEQVRSIDDTYEALHSFFDLVSYNYYFMLKKFDPMLPENDFLYRPRFLNIGCGIIVDDLKDFLECIYLIRDLYIWKNLFEIVIEVYGDSNEFPIKSNVWVNTVSSIMEINKTKEILNIIRYVSGDPDYYPISNGRKPKAVAKVFFNDLTKRVSNEIEKIKVIQKNSKSKILAEKLFPGTEISNLDNYNEKMNSKITSKLLNSSGYIYYDLLSYVKTYTISFIKKDLNDIINLLIIKGQWKSPELSRKVSDNMQGLINYYSNLLEFEANLGEQGNYGNRINALLHRVSVGDKSSEKLLLNIISDINKKALVIANEYYSKIYSIEQHLQDCLKDYMRGPSEKELLYNWKDIDIDFAKNNANNSINCGTLIKNVLNNLTLFLKLMDLYLEKKI